MSAKTFCKCGHQRSAHNQDVLMLDPSCSFCDDCSGFEYADRKPSLPKEALCDCGHELQEHTKVGGGHVCWHGIDCSCQKFNYDKDATFLHLYGHQRHSRYVPPNQIQAIKESCHAATALLYENGADNPPTKVELDSGLPLGTPEYEHPWRTSEHDFKHIEAKVMARLCPSRWHRFRAWVAEQLEDLAYAIYPEAKP